MRKIGRNLYHQYTILYGDIYYFSINGHTFEKYTDIDSAIYARKYYDFNKKSWTVYGDNQKVLTGPFESVREYWAETGQYYAQVELPNDIIVSDLYDTKKDINIVQSFLDNENWSTHALNIQKKIGVEAGRRYAGILPIKEGFLIVDTDGNTHFKCNTLEEAEHKRDNLRRIGVII